MTSMIEGQREKTKNGKMKKRVKEVHKYHLHRSDRRQLGKAMRWPSEWASSEKKQRAESKALSTPVH